MAQWDVFVIPAPGSASLLITNLTGHPQIVLPAGFTKNGGFERPTTIELTGKLYGESEQTFLRGTCFLQTLPANHKVTLAERSPH